MLIAALAFAALASGLWCAYLVRYPKQWGGLIDRLHQKLRSYWLSYQWMKRMEKGVTLKIIVATTTVLILCCVAVLLRHPTAMADFIRQLQFTPLSRRYQRGFAVGL